MVVVWAVAMGAWYLVSKYVESTDVERIKDRLVGTTRPRKRKSGKPARNRSFRTPRIPEPLAQMLVDKYRLGPKIGMLLEQAGLRWPPARLVHLCLVAFAAALALGVDVAAASEAVRCAGGAVARRAPLDLRRVASASPG